MALAKKTTIKIEILLPVSGKFKLPYSVGDKVEIDEKQAEILIEAKYAQKVK